MRQLLFIYVFLLLCFAHAQQVNYDLGDILYNPAQSSSKERFMSFSVYDVQSKIASSSRDFNLYGQYEWSEYNSVVGVGVSKNNFSSFSSTDVKLLYNYKVNLDTNSFISFGLRSGLAMAKLSNLLIFEDQLSLFDVSVQETKEELIRGNQTAFVTDVGVVLKKGDFNIGASVLNLIKPSWAFSEAEVTDPMSINTTVAYEVNVNSSRTLKFVPYLFGSYSTFSTKIGLNTKLEFSGYEGFEGKVYGGTEFISANGQNLSNTWQIYFGYSQDKLSFQYGYGNVLSYAKQLGSSNYLMLSYQFND